jgi:phage shock protein PspC (stress-responsive transcriptional regulator)
MKKTVSVNIKGMNFLIEEDAYELLQNYMDRLTIGLQNEKGDKEIIEDIELRIAELCSEALSDRKQVIERVDIEKILSTLGDPSQYLDESEDNFSSSQSTETKDKEKRIFRDTDRAMIAGVCSGISNYTNIDIAIIRAIFVAILIFGGFGFPLYIVLWIIIPKATSTIDKLRMQGKPITVENVRDEVEQAADRMSKGSTRFANKIRKDDSYQQRISSVARIFSVLFGTGIIAIGLLFLTLFTVFVVGGFQVIPVQSESGFLSFPDFGNLVVENPSDTKWAWIAILLVGFSSTLFLLLLGSKIVFRIHNMWSRLALGALFTSGFIGLIIGLVVGLKTAREMAIEGEIERNIGIVASNELNITTIKPKLKASGNIEIKSKGRYGMMSIEGDQIVESGIHIEYRTSKDSLFHVYQNLTANSHSHQTAIKKARNIRHTVELIENELKVHSHYSFPKKDKLRDQDVEIIIEVPNNGKVYVNNELVLPSKDGLSTFLEGFEKEYHDGFIDSRGEYSK